MAGNNKTDIFISYRREDGEEFARRLADALISMGYDVFFDRHSLQLGCVFPDEIQTALESCSEFIAVCSKAYLGENSNSERRILEKDDWVAREIEIALNRNIQIFPVNISNQSPPDKSLLPEKISKLLDYNFCFFDESNSLDELLSSLSSLFTAETRDRKERTALINKLIEIGDGQQSPNFNVPIRSLVIQMSENEVKNTLYPLITASDCDESLHFTAYYAVYTFYRRYSSHHIIDTLINDYSKQFEGFRFNNIALSQYYRFRFEDESNDSEDLSKAIKYAKLGVETISDNYGVLLTYAELVAIALENGLMSRKKELKYAVLCMEKAMQIKSDYPKAYAILGRLTAFAENTNKALLQIKKAIDLEDTQIKDAFLRINQYQSYITDIKIRQAKKQCKHLVLASFTCLLAVILLILAMIILF